MNDADKKGSLVTVGGDSRITRVGAVIRKYRLDEIPQLINVLCGDMSFVGTRLRWRSMSWHIHQR